MAKIVNATLSLKDTTIADDEDVITRAFLERYVNYGTQFVRVSNSQVKLTPAGLDGKARVVLFDGSDPMGFTITGDVTADITSSGANGLDTGAEGASTFYIVWGIGKSDGTFALLLSTSTTSPTMPSGYTFKKVLWGVSNNASSNFSNFVHLSDGRCLYTDTEDNSVRGLAVLIGGTSTSPAAVSMARAVPDIVGVVVAATIRAANADTTNSVFTVSEDSGQTVQIVNARTVGNTGPQLNTEHWETTVLRNTGSIATSLYYDWGTNSGSQSCTVYVLSWNLGVTW